MILILGQIDVVKTIISGGIIFVIWLALEILKKGFPQINMSS